MKIIALTCFKNAAFGNLPALFGNYGFTEIRVGYLLDELSLEDRRAYAFHFCVNGSKNWTEFWLKDDEDYGNRIVDVERINENSVILSGWQDNRPVQIYTRFVKNQKRKHVPLTQQLEYQKVCDKINDYCSLDGNFVGIENCPLLALEPPGDELLSAEARTEEAEMTAAKIDTLQFAVDYFAKDVDYPNSNIYLFRIDFDLSVPFVGEEKTVISRSTGLLSFTELEAQAPRPKPMLQTVREDDEHSSQQNALYQEQIQGMQRLWLENHQNTLLATPEADRAALQDHSDHVVQHMLDDTLDVMPVNDPFPVFPGTPRQQGILTCRRGFAHLMNRASHGDLNEWVHSFGQAQFSYIPPPAIMPTLPPPPQVQVQSQEHVPNVAVFAHAPFSNWSAQFREWQQIYLNQPQQQEEEGSLPAGDRARRWWPGHPGYPPLQQWDDLGQENEPPHEEEDMDDDGAEDEPEEGAGDGVQDIPTADPGTDQ